MSQYLLAVFVTDYICRTDTPMEFDCDISSGQPNVNLINGARYYKARAGATCPPVDNTDLCSVSSVLDEIRGQCHEEEDCSFTVAQRDTSVCESQGFTGEDIIEVQHSCQPGNT